MKLKEFKKIIDCAEKRLVAGRNGYVCYSLNNLDVINAFDDWFRPRKKNGDYDLRVDDINPNNRLFLVNEPTSLKHQEHKEISLPPGAYRSRIQREYDPFTKRIREVAD